MFPGSKFTPQLRTVVLLDWKRMITAYQLDREARSGSQETDKTEKFLPAS
jgi:hypothetical protein